jgi:hypothetical protein
MPTIGVLNHSIKSHSSYVKITCDNDIMVTIQCEIYRLLKFFPNLLTTVRRNISLGGGVVVFVKDEINCVTRLDLHVGSVECIWLEIKINNKKIASLVQQGWANLRV